MENTNILAIKTLDRLLSMSDSDLANYFITIDQSDISEILLKSGIFESAKNKSAVVYGQTEENDNDVFYKTLVSQQSKFFEDYSKIMSTFSYSDLYTKNVSDLSLVVSSLTLDNYSNLISATLNQAITESIKINNSLDAIFYSSNIIVNNQPTTIDLEEESSTVSVVVNDFYPKAA